MNDSGSREKWMIKCPTCDEWQPATLSLIGFVCDVCNRRSDTDIPAYDITEAEKYRDEFIGAKIAGMIKEDDGDPF